MDLLRILRSTQEIEFLLNFWPLPPSCLQDILCRTPPLVISVNIIVFWRICGHLVVWLWTLNSGISHSQYLHNSKSTYTACMYVCMTMHLYCNDLIIIINISDKYSTNFLWLYHIFIIKKGSPWSWYIYNTVIQWLHVWLTKDGQFFNSSKFDLENYCLHELFNDGCKNLAHSAESFQSLISLQFKLSQVGSLKEILLIQVPVIIGKEWIVDGNYCHERKREREGFDWPIFAVLSELLLQAFLFLVLLPV